MAIGSTNGHSHLVAHHLGGEHGEGLALRRIHLAGHDGATRLVLRQRQLAQAATWSGAQETNIVGDLHQADGDGVKDTMDLHHGVAGGQSLELVGGSDEGQAGQISDLGGALLGESLASVQASADGSATESQLIDAGQAGVDPLQGVGQLLGIAAKLLAEGQRYGIHGVGATDLDDVLELIGLGAQGVVQDLDGRLQVVVQLEGHRDVDGRGEGIIGALRLVDMVIGMHWGLGAQLSAHQLDGTIADNLLPGRT